MISSEWIKKDINNPEAKESFLTYLGNNQRLLLRLKELLEDRERNIDSTSFSLSSFEDASWAYKQAFLNGQRSTLKDIIKLITIG